METLKNKSGFIKYNKTDLVQRITINNWNQISFKYGREVARGSRSNGYHRPEDLDDRHVTWRKGTNTRTEIAHISTKLTREKESETGNYD